MSHDPFDHDAVPPVDGEDFVEEDRDFTWEPSAPTFTFTPPASRPGRASRAAGMGPQVWRSFLAVMAACDKLPASQIAALIAQVRVSANALDELDDDHRRRLVSVLELVEFELSVASPESTVALAECVGLEFASAQTVKDVDAILAIAAPDRPENPMGSWVALCNEVQSRRTRRQIDVLATSIDAHAPIAEQLDIYDKLEPPATRVAVIREEGIRTVDKLLEELEEAGATSVPYRLSSGFPTLDASQTGEHDELGIIAPGENLLILGPTGTGKSSLEYALHRGTTLSLIQAYPDALSILAHTEEESRVKAQAIGLCRGQRWHFLAKNVIIENIGSSRRRLAELFYETVAHAVRRAQETGRHPVEFVVHKMHIDYLQAIAEQGETEQTSVITTSEMILRGFQACNPAEIEKYSGVNFTRYTGMKWPEELEHHRVAVISYGQLRKSGSDATVFYDPNNKKHSLNQFALEDTSDDPAWTDASGNKWCWEVQPGDFRLFTKDDIYGSSKPLQNATSVLLLHRSRPQKNPIAYRDEHGHPHLADTRARLILDKARNGQSALYVPMAFDVMPEGFRAQYYDVIGESLVNEKLIEVEDHFSITGDPMIPKRPKRSPFADFRY